MKSQEQVQWQPFIVTLQWNDSLIAASFFFLASELQGKKEKKETKNNNLQHLQFEVFPDTNSYGQTQPCSAKSRATPEEGEPVEVQ